VTQPAVDAAPGQARTLKWWREVLYGVGVYVVYSVVRNAFGSAGGDPEPAFNHARAIIAIERHLSLYFEAHLQQWYLDLPAHGLIRLWNIYYGLAHFLVTAGALIWLFRRDPERYPVWRNTLALTTCLAVIGFATFSLMPPRLLDDPGPYGGCQVYTDRHAPPPDLCHRYGFVDTIDEYGGWASFSSSELKSVSNQYAAMPSMHIGWSTWSALVMFPLVRRRWAKALVAGYPLITLTCILLTANHYWIDGIGGLVCLGAGYLVARRVTVLMARRHGLAALDPAVPG
jgi:hypothetical protein